MVRLGGVAGWLSNNFFPFERAVREIKPTVSLLLLCSRIKDFYELEWLIYSPKSKVVQEGIISSFDLEAPARNDGCPQGKVHPGRCPQPPSRNQSPYLLNTQHLPKSIFFLVFQAAAYVSYSHQRGPEPPRISNCAPSRLSGKICGTAADWTVELL